MGEAKRRAEARVAVIIGGKSCRSCEYVNFGESDRKWYCSLYPPTPFFVPQKLPNGTITPVVISTFPPVDPDRPCGQYLRSEEKAAREIAQAKPAA